MNFNFNIDSVKTLVPRTLREVGIFWRALEKMAVVLMEYKEELARERGEGNEERAEGN